MQSAFKQYYQDYANNVVKEFKTANYKEFNGGSGTATDPFLISNEQQLKNIEAVSMKAHYKLSNSITLSTANWTPIGDFNKEKRFEGSFDGNGWYINDLKRTADIAEQNGRIYFGLFGCIGESGVVKNLSFGNCNIKVVGHKQNNANSKVFVGVLAGSVYGTVNNVKVFGACSYDVCTSGESYVGSIAGHAYGANISNCINYAYITSGRYGGIAGGMVGYSAGATISNCKNYGTITAKGTAWFGHSSAGGMVGEKYDAKQNSYLITNIINCFNYGKLNATDYGGGPKCAHYYGDLCAKEQSDIYG